MCVAVTLEPGTDLTQDEVTKMHRSNADGIGIAWARDGVVQWWKTTKVDPEYVTRVVRAWREFPRLVHFRYATAGGARPDLCHPFEVSATANPRITGEGTKVMIHNGTWGRWEEVKNLLDKEGLLPPGPWSDTRLIAFLAHEDPEWLKALGGRVAIMTGDGTIARLGDWTTLRKGILVSNEMWKTATVVRGGYAGYRGWKGWQWTEAEAQAFYGDDKAAIEVVTGSESKGKEKLTNAEYKAQRRAERVAAYEARKAERGQPNHRGSNR